MEGTEGHGGKRDRRVARERAIFGRSSAVGTCHGEREKKRRVPRARTYTLTQRRSSGCKKRSREREREGIYASEGIRKRKRERKRRGRRHIARGRNTLRIKCVRLVVQLSRERRLGGSPPEVRKNPLSDRFPGEAGRGTRFRSVDTRTNTRLRMHGR